MKGTIIDFFDLASENEELGRAIANLAAEYDFEFTDELSEDDLGKVAGGVTMTWSPTFLWTPPPPPTTFSGKTPPPSGGSAPPPWDKNSPTGG